MKILITSGTGKVGSELTKRIFGLGHDPVVMTHSIEHLKELPDGVEGVLADFHHSESWVPALQGIKKLCLITPPLIDEADRGTAFAKFAIESGVEQVVFLSIFKLEAATHIPHFYAKSEIERAIRSSGCLFTFIRSNNFFQNDLHFVPFMEEQGMYVQPLGRTGLNRVDVRDVADAMAHALMDERHYLKTYQLVGRETLSGSKTAKFFSDFLGNKISYPDNCLEQWERNMKPYFPDWLLEDMKMMYEFFLLDGLVANKYDIKSTKDILGKEPRLFEDYLKELLGEKPPKDDIYGDWVSRKRPPGPLLQT